MTGIDKQQVGQVAAEIRESCAARALQGQGRASTPTRRSSARKARRSRGPIMSKTNATLCSSAGAHAYAAAPGARPAVLASASFRSASTSTPRSSTTPRATPSPPLRRSTKDLKGSLKTGADTAAAAAIGKLIAERATKAGVKEVVFDRGAYIYHGRVKALADSCPRRRPQLLKTFAPGDPQRRRISSSTVLPEKQGTDMARNDGTRPRPRA